MKAIDILSIILILVVSCNGAKILALLGVLSPSHHIFNRALTRALGSRGHQVTVLSGDADKDVPNVTYLKMEGVYEKLQETVDYEKYVEDTPLELTLTMFDWIQNSCRNLLNASATKKLLESTEKFDLIITEAAFTECVFGFIPKFGSPPVVGISGFGIPPWISDLLGTPENPSYIPNTILPLSDHMSFSERVYNTFMTSLQTYMYKFSHIPKIEEMAKEFFKTEQPSYLNIVANFSILLANVGSGLDGARPLSPNVIPIGGMHIKEKPDSLPKDIQHFLDGAKDGFIFFSLGSNLHSDALPEEKLRDLLGAFAELPQRILWKFESENLAGLPPNVKIGKWLPQSDILAHPNIKAFISHCGKMSTTESVYRGVPIIGVPFFADQMLNLKQMMTKGVAVELNYLTLTKDRVLAAVREILHNQSYEMNMKKLSAIFRDHPQSALDRAVYWTEYVIRHQGAPHLRPSSRELYWYQYLLLDIALVFASGLLLIVTIFYFLIRKLLRLVKGKSTKKSKLN